MSFPDAEQLQHLRQRELHDGGAGIGCAVINQHGFALFDNARGENHIGDEALALVICFRDKDLAARAENSSRVFEIPQQEAGGVSADPADP